MKMDESCSVSFDIPKIVVEKVKVATASELSLLLLAIVALIYRYTGCEKIQLNVKIELDKQTI